jgi:uncharacterized phage protein gp47/JayE
MTRYQQRTFEEIIQSMRDYFAGANQSITDWNEGSIIRTILEAVAQEQARQYLGFLIGINEAQEESAYTTFGFDRLPAARAYGQVLFARDVSGAVDPNTAVVVPKGSIVSVAGSTSFRYELQNDVTLTADAPNVLGTVVAISAGAVYNVAAGAIDTLESNVPGVASVTNPRAFITGSDAESDGQRRARFAQFLTGIHRATRDAILFGVKQATVVDADGFIVEQVLKANTIEVGPGTIYVYINNGVSGASLDLQTAAQNQLSGYTDQNGVQHPGWKAAGITSVVFIATEVPIDVEVTIEIEDGRVGSVVSAQVAKAIQDYFATLDVGDTVRIESIKMAVRRTAGVLDIVTLNTPVFNLPQPYSAIAVAGQISVTVQS